jgi:hypothetical protein
VNAADITATLARQEVYVRRGTINRHGVIRIASSTTPCVDCGRKALEPCRCAEPVFKHNGLFVCKSGRRDVMVFGPRKHDLVIDQMDKRVVNM